MDRRREKPEPDSAAQLERFKETARALGCDEDEAAFDERLKAIARQKPKGEPAPAAQPPPPGRTKKPTP